MIDEFAGKLGVAREMHPPEFLDRRKPSGQAVGIDRAIDAGKAQAVLQRKELGTAGLFVLDCEADEVLRGFPTPPVHRDEGHPVAAVKLE